MADNRDSRDRSRSRDRDRDRSGGRGDKRARSRGRSRDRNTRRKDSNNRVFVSNISYDCRWQDLKDLFRSHVGEVSYVELFNDENDKPRGCGIVEFADEKSVKKCLEVMHRLDCKGRKLVVREDFNDERDRYGRLLRRDRERDRSNLPDLRDEIQLPSLMNMSTATSNTPDWGNTYGLSHKFLESLGINGPLLHRVFVANLDYKVTEKKLLEVFKLAGKVLSVEITQDKEGNSRGFGVVEYDHPVESVQAISMFNGQQLYDRKLIVRMDREKNDGFRLPEGLRNVGLGLGANGEPLRDVGRYLASNSINMNSIKPKNSLLDSISNPVLQSGLNPATAVALNNVINTPNNLLSLANSQAAAIQASLASVGGLTNPLLTSNLNMTNDLNLANLTNSNILSASLNQPQQTLSSFNTNSASNLNFSQRSLDNFNTPHNYTTIHSDLLNRDNSRDRGEKDRDQSSGSRLYNPEEDSDYRQTSVYSTINNGSQNRNQAMSNQRNDTVLISNLHPSTTWNMVREKFRSFGDVLNIEVKGSNAIVQFADPRHAEQAIINFRGSTTDVKYF